MEGGERREEEGGAAATATLFAEWPPGLLERQAEMAQRPQLGVRGWDIWEHCPPPQKSLVFLPRMEPLPCAVYWLCEPTAEFSILGHRDFGDHGFLGRKMNTPFLRRVLG